MINPVIPQHDHSCTPKTSIKFDSLKAEFWLRLRRNLVGVGEEGLKTSFLEKGIILNDDVYKLVQIILHL